MAVNIQPTLLTVIVDKLTICHFTAETERGHPPKGLKAQTTVGNYSTITVSLKAYLVTSNGELLVV